MAGIKFDSDPVSAPLPSKRQVVSSKVLATYLSKSLKLFTEDHVVQGHHEDSDTTRSMWNRRGLRGDPPGARGAQYYSAPQHA